MIINTLKNSEKWDNNAMCQSDNLLAELLDFQFIFYYLTTFITYFQNKKSYLTFYNVGNLKLK